MPLIRSSFVGRFLAHPPRSFNETAPRRTFFKWLQQRRPSPTKADYPSLVASRKQHPWLASPLDHQALTWMMARSLDRDQPNLVLRIFDDLGPVWGYKPTQEDIRYYLRACGRTGAVAKGLEWIRCFAGAAADSSRDELLAGCDRFRDGLLVVEQQRLTKKSEREYAHLLRLATAEGLVGERDRLVKEMVHEGVGEGLLVHAAQLHIPQSLAFVRKRVEEGIKLEQWIEVALVAHLCRLGNEYVLFEVLTHLFDPLKPLQDSARSVKLLETLICSIQVPDSLAEAQRLADRLLDLTGIDLFQQPKLASSLFDRLSTSADLERLTHWLKLIHSRNGPVLAKYVGAMLKFRSSVLSQPGLLRKLWEDLTPCGGGPNDSEEWRDLAIDIIRLSLDTNDWGLSKMILDNLEAQKAQLRPEVSEELIERLIKFAPSRDAAYNSYAQLVRLGSPSRPFFDRFLVFYLARCEAASANDAHRGKSQALSMHALSAIFEHMRAAGVPPDTETYIYLLDHFIKVVKSNPRNQSTRLQVERLHTLLKLDAYVEPDTRLLHYFLKGFAYNGMFAQAWVVWKRISSEDRFRVSMTNASVATMLDLAGFEGEAAGDGRLNVQAIDGWALLNGPQARQRWPKCESNKNLWDSWVECLCRARHFSKATEVVLEGMAQNGCRPDRRTCSILLRFCRRESEWRKQSPSTSDEDEVRQEDLFVHVRSRIRDELPEVWNEVWNEGLTPKEIENHRHPETG